MLVCVPKTQLSKDICRPVMIYKDNYAAVVSYCSVLHLSST